MTSPWTSAQSAQSAQFNRRLSWGGPGGREPYPQQISPYGYGANEAGPWDPAQILARSQEFAYPLDCRTLVQGDKYEAAENVLGAQRMYEGAATAEQVKIHESMGPQKPEVKGSQPGASKVEVRKPSSRSARETHIESEQFPTLGNWVASLIGKQTAERASTKLAPDAIGQKPYYQPQSPSTAESYKSTADLGSTGTMASNYMGNGYASIPGRWTTDQQQQQQQQRQQRQTGQSSQQDQLPGTRFLPRQQSFHAPISSTSAALSYSSKYSADLYQSPALLGYNALYPYVTSMTYPRLPSEASLGQQRVSPFAPLESRFYSEVGEVRMPGPIGKRVDYVEQQSQYARMFTPRELRAYEQQRTGQQRQKIVSPEVSRAGIAKQFNSGVPYGRGSNNASLGEVRKRPGQNLRCSNCGALGSRFECLGCETAVYCNEFCQTQHWSIHVVQCPKIMPKLKKVG
ncbi:PREDICTED: uncharacterized protein LOC105366623 [Ceratosolen solmsi marchali]|uniref:Uncharacterized protein LOC105366623 n=1 Tax=Ceratosolen solmsi marchali TaxID=326594 RepID=A0AAJ6YSK7_9HYME|nr:PREDICTED: uncharacterized protein LOC105366623 [Ceratosolen solmsi marchali]